MPVRWTPRERDGYPEPDPPIVNQRPACHLRLEPPDRVPRPSEAFTAGIALPPGWSADPSTLHLAGPDGSAAPLQARVVERWPDGSARWVLLDFQSAVSGPTPLRLDSRDAAAPPVNGIVVAESAGGAIVTTGAATFTFAAGTASPLAGMSIDGVPAIDGARTRLVAETPDGGSLVVHFDRVIVEERGPMRAAIAMHGRVQANVALNVTVRFELAAGHAAAKVRLVLHNPRAASHPGGFWELGDAGSVLLRRLALEVACAGGPGLVRAVVSVDRDASYEDLATPLRLQQESSGKPNWRSPVHVNRDGHVALRYPGYRLTAGGENREGGQACPIVGVGRDGHAVVATSRLFWEVFPKAYTVGADGILGIELLPEAGDPHELQGGERFTHEWVLGCGDIDAGTLHAYRSPSIVSIDPAWWAVSGAVPHFVPVLDPDALYERLVRAAVDGADTFGHKRDRIDEYGWRHFGDLYADHENGPDGGDAPIVSHYNNQYDAAFGLIVQFMRGGDPRFWDLGRDLATHVAHVDVYWTDEDKSAYNGGLFWHTSHYLDAGLATHRTYPRAQKYGGGPSVEHNYSGGLLLHHFLTGDPWSREAVLRLARWTLEMDDGRLTVFRFLSRRPTGLASLTATADYHGPGRGVANAVQTLLNAWRLTGEARWLAKAEELIARAIHPDDDLEARQLLDTERRWSYTVFLQALGRYLDTMREADLDRPLCAYARASLLHYARWMAAHEYPYLDKPEILEFPNETWAAQDMRKAEVFDLAARHASDARERARFVERACFFYDSSLSSLAGWATRTFTRPVVLLLSYGFAHLWHECHRHALPLRGPASDGRFGAPARFVGQKTIALGRARMMVAAGTVAAVLGALALAF